MVNIKNPLDKDWYVLEKECVDCLVEGGGLVYLDNFDSVTREIGSILKFNSYAEACGYLERVLGETQRRVLPWFCFPKRRILAASMLKSFFHDSSSNTSMKDRGWRNET